MTQHLETASGVVIVLQPEGVEIPAGIRTLAEFRAWACSDPFPERGRIDWVRGRMEVDLAPEDINTHGSPKSAMAVRLGVLVQESRRGMVFIDRTRLSCAGADLSAEPDVLVLLVETLRSGRARLIPRASGEPGRYLEIEGTADLVVECVSDSSTGKDKRQLREAYQAAGVTEYWLVDARRSPVQFDLLHLQEGRYVSSPVDAEGYRHSPFLRLEVRLARDEEAAGLVFFRLDVRTDSPRP